VRLLLPDRGYARPEASLAFCEELRQRARALPGVRSAALSTNLPVADRELNQLAQFSVEDRPPESRADVFVQNFRRVSSDYFRTVGIPLRAGRAFDETDRADAPGVVVVSERLADLYWPGTSPIGRRMKRGVYDSANPWLTVVGVVGDVQDAALDLPPAPTFYLPFPQNPGQAVSLVLAAAGDPTALAGPVRGIVRELDPDLPVYRIASLEQILADSLARNRFSAFVLGTFASLGLVLAVVGLYALVSYTVSQQHREIAVRMTLGARAGAIARMIVLRSLALTAIGLAGGVLGALALGRLLAGELYGVSPTDPLVFAATAVLLAAVAALAGYIPARRATRTDPVALLLRAG
jgi:putative ABC transport system permease protein